MAVARGQQYEILRLLEEYVGEWDDVIHLLLDLSRTEAYRRNKSFRDTIDGLTARARSNTVVIKAPK